MAPRKRPRQQTLEATLGRPKLKSVVKPRRAAEVNTLAGRQKQTDLPKKSRDDVVMPSSRRPPPPSFLPSSGRKSMVTGGSSSESVAEGSFSDGEKPQHSSPPKGASSLKRRRSDSPASGLSRSPTLKPAVADGDSDSASSAAPTSSMRRTPRKRAVALDDSDEDAAVQPTKKRRLIRKVATSESESDGVLVEKEQTRLSDSERKATEGLYTPMKRGVRRSAQSSRSARRKHMELLRRRRAGEVIAEEDLASSSDDGQKGIYDTDSDNPALSEFTDEYEGMSETAATPEQQPRRGMKMPKMAGQEKKRASPLKEDEENLEDFVVEDDDALLGAPAELLDIPLEFTAHSHKPLKEHFKHVVEWIVQTKVNPGFAERKHALYMMAWRKLDDEVRGLAESKFSSSAWKPDFFLALRARPDLTSSELPKGDTHEWETCMACGRSNHPARFVISFHGAAYHKNATDDHFLEDVESDESSSESSSEDGDRDYDEHGNPIPSQDKQWFVGTVCDSNAETAHTLIHWKHALMEYVENALDVERFMEPEKLKEREKMKPKKRYAVVDSIIKDWTDRGVVRDLYREFKNTLSTARNKTTTGKAVRGKGW